MEVATKNEKEDLTEGNEQAIEHIAGYVARPVLNVHKCQPCQSHLICEDVQAAISKILLQELKSLVIF